jgi:hypothetical protein
MCDRVELCDFLVSDSSVHEGLTLSWPAGHICPTYKESFQVHWDNSIPLFLHAAFYFEVSLFRWTSQNAFSHKTSMYKWYCVPLHTVLCNVMLCHWASTSDVSKDCTAFMYGVKQSKNNNHFGKMRVTQVWLIREITTILWKNHELLITNMVSYPRRLDFSGCTAIVALRS